MDQYEYDESVHPLATKYHTRDFKKTRFSRVAIICCSHNGESSLLPALMSAKRQSDVYLYDDASTDSTANIGIRMGIPTLRGEKNIGKARGIRRMLDHKFNSLGNRRIPEVYDFVMILDDDTILSPKYVPAMVERFDADQEIVVLEGRLVSDWKPDQNTNGFIAARSMISFLVHVLLTFTQSLLRARTWINGAIAIYRSEILDNVVRRDPKFITEDNDWCWQIHRAKAGRVKFVFSLTARLQEPQTFKELYNQHLRWNWGMFQVAREHKCGLRLTMPDVMWLFTMLLTIRYLFMPIVNSFAFSYAMADIRMAAVWFFGRYIVYSFAGAIISRQWQHMFLFPYFILYDFNWRVSVIHGLIKAIRRPVLKNVTWVSPTRHIMTKEDVAA